MIKTFVLLVYIGYRAGGFSHEFDNKEACENAGKEYVEMVKTFDHNVRYKCVLKR
jgi:hypothetical protein